MLGDRMGLKAKTWCKVIVPRQREGKFKGELSIFRLSDGKLLKKFELNTIQTALLNASAKGAATGTFVEVCNKMEFWESGPTTLAIEDTTKIAGGTGAEDYVTFEAEYTNGSGSAKTVDALDLGYDLGGGGDTVHASKASVNEVVEDTDGLKVQWKITFSYDSGDLLDHYRYELIEMLNTGAMGQPKDIIFVNGGIESASLEAGGTGAEAYHQWTATYTAVGAITIDIIELVTAPGIPGGDIYTEDDITDKALVLD
ncbi:hypothetical protein KA005_71385, partial [bacterium]|nr:hypothetical protein [bacterium]